jgi:hypothetical protein
MKGRAFDLLTSFQASLQGASAPFVMSRLILSARVIPEKVTADLDDPIVERRLEEAIARLRDELRVRK